MMQGGGIAKGVFHALGISSILKIGDGMYEA
jgi:hypothetical protein